MEFSSIHKPLNLSGFAPESVKNQLEYISPSLEKSILADTFGNSGSISSRIIGTEIKSGLEKVIKFSSTESARLKADMEKCLKNIETKPSTLAGRYITRGLDAFIPEVPKLFSYQEIEILVASERSSISNYSSDNCLMVKYNDMARAYINSSVEIIYAKAMMSGIEDSQYYYLNIQQATQVGLGS